jgi:hypothetical protein
MSSVRPIGFDVPADLHRAMKQVALDRGVTAMSVWIEAAQLYLANLRFAKARRKNPPAEILKEDRA